MTDAVKVTGADRLAATMRSAGRQLSDWSSVNAAAAARIAQDAARRAPRRTGRLAASIRPQSDKTGAAVSAGGGAIRYAKVQEFGWPPRNIRAQPYLRPAFADNRAATLRLYETRIAEAVSTITGA